MGRTETRGDVESLGDLAGLKPRVTSLGQQLHDLESLLLAECGKGFDGFAVVHKRPSSVAEQPRQHCPEMRRDHNRSSFIISISIEIWRYIENARVEMVTEYDGTGYNVSDRPKVVPIRFNSTSVNPTLRDRAGDQRIVTTRRRIARVATVASARTAREAFHGRGGLTALDWLTASRHIFGGKAALDAAQDRNDFLKAMALTTTTDDDDAGPADFDAVIRFAADSGRRIDMTEPVELYTATITCGNSYNYLHAFHASLASCDEEMEERLFGRFGADAHFAKVRRGIDPGNALVGELVSDPLVYILMQIAADPLSALAEGLDLTIEQRFVH